MFIEYKKVLVIFFVLFSVFGITTQTHATGIFDTITGARDGYSLRTLTSSYSGPLVRVRLTNGDKADVSADINGEVSLTSPVTIVSGSSVATTLSGFISGSDAYVEIWYDQTGTSNITQSTQANQPKIASSGVLIRSGSNNKVAVFFDGTNDTLVSSSVSFAKPINVFSVSSGGSNTTSRFFELGSVARLIYQFSNGMYGGSFLASTTQTTSAYNMKQMSMVFNGASSQLFVNGSSIGSGDIGANDVNGPMIIGGGTSAGFYFNGTISEFLIYATSINGTQRQAIETDQYNTFVNPIVLGVSNANNVYSVRKIVSAYSGPLVRVRLTNGDKADVSADINGEVSLTSPVTIVSGSSVATTLSGFISGSDAYVEIWYDQLGGVDVKQLTTTSQPKIAISGALITQPNDKVTLRFDGTDDSLTSTSSLIVNQPTSMFMVSSATTNTSTNTRLFDIGVLSNRVLYQMSGGMYAGGFLSSTVTPISYTNKQMSFLFNSSSSQLFSKGILVGSGDPGSNNINGPVILGGTAAGFYLNGTISEFIIYNNNVTTLDRQTIENNQRDNLVSKALMITSPSKSNDYEPEVATISYLDQKDQSVSIPYIQTGTTLNFTADTLSGFVPVGGGVKFVLNEGVSGQTVAFDISAPYTASFSNLAKGTYTMDVYIVDSSQQVISGSTYHDRATSIGVGDIYIAIGDSITKGAGGIAGTGCIASGGTITNWSDSISGTVSTDKRNYCQWSSQGPYYVKSWMPELNNELTAYNGYPVFILNEGYGGADVTYSYSSNPTLHPMETVAWQNRVNLLQPNKWLILLGTNNGAGGPGSLPSYVTSNLSSIIGTLKTTYNASPSGIYVATPPYAASIPLVQTFVEPIQSMIASEGVKYGPNFNAYFYNHPELFGDTPAIHPNTNGNLQMARLWALSIIKPRNFTVSQNAGVASFGWDSLSTLDSITTGTSYLSGYNIKYGTSSGIYSTIFDAGNVISKTINSLQNGLQYFFSLQAYGADTETSDLANEVSLTFHNLASSVVATPAAGSYSQSQSVVLSTTGSETIRYSLTENPADCASGTLYSTPITISTSQTIYTRSCDNFGNSSANTFTYVINSLRTGGHPASPVFQNKIVEPITVINKPIILNNQIVPVTIAYDIQKITKTLKLNSKGSDVKKLQQFLIDQNKGTNAKKLKINGTTENFGQLTRKALAEWQKANGLKADGIFGPKTKEKIKDFN